MVIKNSWTNKELQRKPTQAGNNCMWNPHFANCLFQSSEKAFDSLAYTIFSETRRQREEDEGKGGIVELNCICVCELPATFIITELCLYYGALYLYEGAFVIKEDLAMIWEKH